MDGHLPKCQAGKMRRRPASGIHPTQLASRVRMVSHQRPSDDADTLADMLQEPDMDAGDETAAEAEAAEENDDVAEQSENAEDSG